MNTIDIHDDVHATIYYIFCLLTIIYGSKPLKVILC